MPTGAQARREMIMSSYASSGFSTRHPSDEQLEAALRERGVTDPGRAADLVHGVVLAAARRIDAGGSTTAETRAAERFALAGLEG